MKNEVNADDFNKLILNLLEDPKWKISKLFLLGEYDDPLSIKLFQTFEIKIV